MESSKGKVKYGYEDYNKHRQPASSHGDFGKLWEGARIKIKIHEDYDQDLFLQDKNFSTLVAICLCPSHISRIKHFSREDSRNNAWLVVTQHGKSKGGFSITSRMRFPILSLHVDKLRTPSCCDFET